MAYREKLAWLNLLAMLAAYAVYFGVVGPAVHFGQARLLDMIWGFGCVAAAHAVVVIIGAIVIATTAHQEARAPADERDRAIARRGCSVAYYVLIVGMMLVGVAMPFTEPAWKIANSALLAIVVAELAHYAIVVWSYRRGAHA